MPACSLCARQTRSTNGESDGRSSMRNFIRLPPTYHALQLCQPLGAAACFLGFALVYAHNRSTMAEASLGYIVGRSLWFWNQEDRGCAPLLRAFSSDTNIPSS